VSELERLRRLAEDEGDEEAARRLARELIRAGDELAAVRVLVAIGYDDLTSTDITVPRTYDPIEFVILGTLNPLFHKASGIELRWYTDGLDGGHSSWESAAHRWPWLWATDSVIHALSQIIPNGPAEREFLDASNEYAKARRLREIGAAEWSDEALQLHRLYRMTEIETPVPTFAMAALTLRSVWPRTPVRLAREAVEDQDRARKDVIFMDWGRNFRDYDERDVPVHRELQWQADHLMALATGAIDPRIK
jgi:hypothetical protein